MMVNTDPEIWFGITNRTCSDAMYKVLTMRLGIETPLAGHMRMNLPRLQPQNPYAQHRGPGRPVPQPAERLDLALLHGWHGDD
jgi:hypothetical protein